MDPNQSSLSNETAPQRNGALIWFLFICGILCLLLSILVDDEFFKVGLQVCAVMMFAIFSLRIVQDFSAEKEHTRQLESRIRLDKAIETIISNESDPAFLTDAEGQIRFQNHAAIERFDEIQDGHLISIFGQLLAAPETLLFRLQSKATALGASKEEFRTRDGKFRLAVVKSGFQTYLWRLEQSSYGERDRGRAADSLILPMLTVGPSNAVLYLNEAFRNLLSERPRSLGDVFHSIPETSGEICTIDGKEGPLDVLVATIESGAGRKEIYALPAPDQIIRKNGPRAISGAWEAIEDLPVPLLKVDREGRIAASNREARLLFEIDEIDGRHMYELVGGLGRPVENWLREAIEGRGGQVSQFLRGRGTGREKYIQVTLNISHGPDGRHLIAVLNDVTEFKTLEAQFVQSQKMQAIGQLAGGVAHDFNNLLTAISGHCDLLLLRSSPGDLDYGDLNQIHQNANRAASLVRQLLAFSRKQNLQPERIDLRDTLSDLTHLLNRLVGEKIALTFEHGHNLDAIKADKRQLEQVLMNLVVNARDAMPDGGSIVVHTTNRVLNKELLRDRATVPAGKYVELRVNDNGTGIKPERMPKIFEPFFTTKRIGEGTGLGLSTVYGIVKQTGGYIFVESEEGKGSSFLILLPAHDMPIETAPALAPRVDESYAPNGDGVVLLVEDEAPVRAFASRALRLKGYTVLEADCAEAALELLNDPSLSVDIFVTDVIMPGKDGPTWVREALEARPDTKVVFVSGYAEDAFGNERSHVPNSVFLPKPFSLTQLASTIKQQLH